MAFFSQKMILTKTKYKTYNGELLAIVETFKTWKHYLKGYKYKVLILIDHNNLQRFIDTKTWVLGRSTGFKNYQSTIFGLVTIRIKLMELLILYHNILSGMLKKKPFSKLGISKSYIVYNYCWQEYQSWLQRS